MVIEMSLVLQIRLLPLQVGRQPLAEVFLRALKISLVVSSLFSRDTFRIPIGEDIGEGCVSGAW